jgi:hypothetical protein
MDFFFYLTPQAKEIISLINKAKYSVRENVEFCENKNFFGYADFGKKFVICTKNIKNSGFDTKFYINETVYHEAIHIAHHCNGYRPFGISKKNMPLPSNKLQDVKNSVNSSTATSQMEHEAYWMEDKPDKVRYVLQKYCF